MKRLLAATVLVAVAVGGFLIVDRSRPDWYLRLRYPLHYSQYVRVHARRNGLDAAFVAAVIYQESKFDVTARSKSGAIGLMQVTPATARGIAIRTGGIAFSTKDLYNADINIRYGSWYLRDLFAKYHSERLVLAAYNAGQGNVDRWLAAHEPIQFSETRAYISRVEQLKSVYRSAWGHDLGYG